MITIIDKSKDLTKLEEFVLTKKASAMVKNHIGDIVTIKKWIVYKDKKENGDEVRVLAFLDESGLVYATNSTHFIADFDALIHILDDSGKIPPIKLEGGQTKSGRKFVQFSPLLKEA